MPAYANLPPCGPIHDAEVRRKKLIREQTSPDPVERWRLREERIGDGLTAAAGELVRQAQKNRVTTNTIKGIYQRREHE